jgi:hypothetical protein
MYVFQPRLRALSICVILYFLTGMAAALYLGNSEFLFYEAQMAVIMAIIVYMDRRVAFSPLVLWGLALWGFLHLAGGLVPIPPAIAEPGEGNTLVLYNMRLLPWLPKYDQVIHAYGFGMSALAAHEALQAHLGRKIAVTLPIAALLFLVACGLGAVNELMEFAAVKAIPQTNVGGYFNTGWDLVSNATGAVIAILFLKARRL